MGLDPAQDALQQKGRQLAAAVGFEDGEETNFVERRIEGKRQRGAGEIFIDRVVPAARWRDADETGAVVATRTTSLML